MLVDELRVPVATQKNGKIVKPGNDPLQLDTVHKEHRHGCFVFSHVVQENILNVLRLFVGHGEYPSSCRSFYRGHCTGGSWLGLRSIFNFSSTPPSYKVTKPCGEMVR
jgi:hypothetical protein